MAVDMKGRFLASRQERLRKFSKSNPSNQNFFSATNQLITRYIRLVVKIQSLITLKITLQGSIRYYIRSADGHMERTDEGAIRAMCPV